MKETWPFISDLFCRIWTSSMSLSLSTSATWHRDLYCCSCLLHSSDPSPDTDVTLLVKAHQIFSNYEHSSLKKPKNLSQFDTPISTLLPLVIMPISILKLSQPPGEYTAPSYRSTSYAFFSNTISTSNPHRYPGWREAMYSEVSFSRTQVPWPRAGFAFFKFNLNTTF